MAFKVPNVIVILRSCVLFLCLAVIAIVYVLTAQNGGLEVAQIKHLQQIFYMHQNVNVTRKFHQNSSATTATTEKPLEWLDRTTSIGYRYYGDGTCRDNPDREGLTKLIKKWTEMAKEYEIRYFLDAGTLLGAWRDEDLIPYDLDVDMGVHVDDLKSIAEIPIRLRSLVFDPLADHDFHLVFTPNWTLPYRSRVRYNCDGQVTPRYVDECSFTDPMARLIYRKWYIDLYPYEEGENKARFKYLPNRRQIAFQKSDFFPLVECNYGGVRCKCPRNPLPLLYSLYSSFVPEIICVRGHWIKNRKALRAKVSTIITPTVLLHILLFSILVFVICYVSRRKRSKTHT